MSVFRFLSFPLYTFNTNLFVFAVYLGELDAGRHCGSWPTQTLHDFQRRILEMARDNILLAYVAVDVLFVVTGALLIIFAINTQVEIAKPFTKDNVVKDLLLEMCPLNGKGYDDVGGS